MTVLDRAELQESPLADLHLIADQLGLEGFRRLRKADLIEAILDADGQDGGEAGDSRDEKPERRGSRRARSTRSRRSSAKADLGAKADLDVDDYEESEGEQPAERASERASGSRRGRARAGREKADDELTAEGVVEVLGNGSAFLRLSPPDSSPEDVYVSAAQVRRCELVSGDRVSGPVRAPRRSERYHSLVRVATINGEPADAVSEGTRYEELPVSYPSERLALDSDDATLKAVEWLTPLGLGSRCLIVGGHRAGKTETLRRMLAALAGREGIELSLVLTGARPEEISEWCEGPVEPAAALSFAASPDAQGQAAEAAIDTAKRVAARGGDAIVLIDGLDGLHPHTARKLLVAARNLTDAGSLTVIATAAHPFGGETTTIALDPVRAGTGQPTALDLVNSGTLKPELLVGEEGAEAIARARAHAAG